MAIDWSTFGVDLQLELNPAPDRPEPRYDLRPGRHGVSVFPTAAWLRATPVDERGARTDLTTADFADVGAAVVTPAHQYPTG